MHFTTRRDQKQKMYLFLLSLTALSICTFNMGDKGLEGIGTSRGKPSGSKHISAPRNSVVYKGWLEVCGNSSREVDFGGSSRSLNSFANDPIV